MEISFISVCLDFYSSVVGAAIVAILTLPKLVSKHLKARKLNKEITLLKKRNVELEKQNVEKSQGM